MIVPGDNLRSAREQRVRWDPKQEFERFHELLMEGAPYGYSPSYIPIEAGTKKPVGNWANTSGNFHDAIKMLEAGINVGIAAREDDYLTILDIDDPDEVDYLKPTLTVRSGSRSGDHAYYFGDGENADSGSGEVRTENAYCVCPGSQIEPQDPTWPMSGIYTVESERPSAWITRQEYPSFLRDAMTPSKSAVLSGELDIEDEWHYIAIREEIRECMHRADEWNDGGYRTLSMYIIPRVNAINADDNPNHEIDLDKQCREWCDRANVESWSHYKREKDMFEFDGFMSTSTFNEKSYGPDDLTDFWKMMT